MRRRHANMPPDAGLLRWNVRPVWLAAGILLVVAGILLVVAGIAGGETMESAVFLQSLTAEERDWLRDHPVIRVAQAPDWSPVEFADARGEPSGISEDYLRLIEQRLGIDLERERGLNWQEAYERMKRSDWAILAGTLDKALDSISEAERMEIYRRWVPVYRERGPDYTLLWWALGILTGILLVSGAWIRRLAREIGQRKQAEAMSAESEGTLRDIIESTLSGFWDWSLLDNTEYLSPTFKRMFGYENHEMESSPEAWQKIIFPKDLSGVLAVLDRHVKGHGREPFYNEIRYRHRDGSTVWLICAGRVIEWAADGTAIRMAGCHIDITGSKWAVEQLADEAGRRRLLKEQSRDGIAILDQDGQVVESNRNSPRCSAAPLSRCAGST